MSSTRTRGSPPFLPKRSGPGVQRILKVPNTLMYFNFKNYLGLVDAMIYQRGIFVDHTSSVACPCVETNRYGGGGVPNPVCVDCHGLGVSFPSETTARVRALVSDINAQDANAPQGEYQSGTLKITFPSEFYVAKWDRIVMPDVVVPLAKMWVHDASSGGKILPFDVKDVIILTAKGPDPKEPLITLTFGSDYTVDAERNAIEFPSGSRVTDGMVVSGKFVAIPSYIVTEVFKNARGLLSSLKEDANFMALSMFVSATRADILMNQ